MSDTDIYTKTSAGTEEISSRSRTHKLPQRLRTMLIMVDGIATVAQLGRAASALGAPVDFLQLLEQAGLVEKRAMPKIEESSAAPGAPTLSEAERFRAAQKFMNDTVVDALGLRAFFFTLKIEKCYALADLRQLLPDFTKAVTKGMGPDVGRVIEARAREILN